MKKLTKKEQRKLRNNLTVYQLNKRTNPEFRLRRAKRIKENS
jgi:hypothetical protein